MILCLHMYFLPASIFTMRPTPHPSKLRGIETEYSDTKTIISGERVAPHPRSLRSTPQLPSPPTLVCTAVCFLRPERNKTNAGGADDRQRNRSKEDSATLEVDVSTPQKLLWKTTHASTSRARNPSGIGLPSMMSDGRASA